MLQPLKPDEYIFLGGPIHGQVVTVDEGAMHVEVLLPNPSDMPDIPYAEGFAEATEGKALYTRRDLRMTTRERYQKPVTIDVTVFAPPNLTADQVSTLLRERWVSDNA